MIALTEQKPDTIMINGEEVRPVLIENVGAAISMKQAALYLDISASALNRKLDKAGIKRYQRGVGRERYVLFKDVQRLASFHEVSDASDPE